MTKIKSIKTLRKHLSTLFDARYRGTSNVSYAQNQGFVDGYMQAMGDLSIIEDSELLKIVATERELAAKRSDAAVPTIGSSLTVENFA